MKVILRSLLLVLIFVLPARIFAQTLIAGWDFQTTTNGGTAAAVAPNSPLVFTSNVGTGTMYLDGTNGSSTWIKATSGNELTAFGGSNLNTTGTTLSTTITSPSCLALLGGTGESANGKTIILKFSMTGLKNLSVSYVTMRTATGFTTQQWDYSTDGTTWNALSTIVPSAVSTFLVEVLPTITGLDNASVAYLRFTGTGATGTSGNNRLDNIQLNAYSTVFYSNSSGDLSSLASYGTNTDGTGTAPTDFNGSGSGALYQLANRSSYALTTSLTLGAPLYIPAGSTLDLAGNTLTATVFNGGGTLTGSSTSALVLNRSTNFAFASGKEQLSSLTLGSGAAAILTSVLNIVSTGTVTLGASSSLATGGLLTLKSDASGTAAIAALGTSAAITGNVTAERYLADKRAWRLIASPVSTSQTINAAWQEGAASVSSNPNPGFGTFMAGGSTANGFDIASTSGSLMVYSGGALSIVGSTTGITPSTYQGFFLFSIGSRSISPTDGTSHSSTVLRTTGTVKQGTQATVLVSPTGYTLVGNPYPSAVDFSAVTRSATVPNSFYAWDINLGSYGGYVLVSNSGGGYTEVPTSPSGLTNIIPSGGAIFLQSDGINTGVVTFAEASKAGAGNQNFGNFPAALPSTAHNFRVNLTDGTLNLIDGVMASFAPGYSDNVDAGDASKLFNFYENIALTRAGKQLIVEQRSDLVAKDTIFIQLSGVKTSTYKLQVDPTTFNEPGMTAYLEDAYAHTRTELDLSQVSNISFTTNAADSTTYKNRFDIAFIPAVTAVTTSHSITAEGAGVIAYPNPATQKQVNLSFAAGLPVGNYNITMANSVGQLVQKDSMMYTGTTANKVLSANYTPGIYIVNVQTNGYRQSIKVIIN